MIIKINKWTKFLLSISLCLCIGFIGSQFNSTESQIWYENIKKPFWNPPKWVFPIVWNILFVLMGCALGIVWSLKTQTPRFWAYLFFFLQLIFNGLWSFFFFYLHDPLLAFIDIIALWLAIVLTLLAFWQHSRLAACLLIPYLLWVSFAILINLWITIYN